MTGIKVGDKIKILVDEAEMAEVSKGDILTVVKVINDGVTAEKRKGTIPWCFSEETMGEEWDIYKDYTNTNNRDMIPGSIDDVISRY